MDARSFRSVTPMMTSTSLASSISWGLLVHTGLQVQVNKTDSETLGRMSSTSVVFGTQAKSGGARRNIFSSIPSHVGRFHASALDPPGSNGQAVDR